MATDRNGSNSSSNSCLQFSPDDLRQLLIVRTSLASVVCLLCCVAVVMIFATKAYRKFVHRLTLYLIISAFCESLMFGVQVIPVTITHDLLSVRMVWEGACAAIGFLAQYSVWCELLFICWITLYLFLLAVFKSNPFTRKHEVAGVTLSVSIPLLFNWVPFLDDMYGLSGAWCWIRFTEGGCDGSYAQGLAYQIGMWYGPLIVIVSISFIATFILVAAMCRGAFCSRSEERIYQPNHRKALKEALPLLIYPVVFNVLNCYAAANRIHYATGTLSQDKEPQFSLWMLHSVLYSLHILIIPLGFLFHPYTCGQIKGAFKRSKKHEDDSQPSYTMYIVPPDSLCTEGDFLVVKGRESEVQNYKTWFDATTQLES